MDESRSSAATEAQTPADPASREAEQRFRLAFEQAAIGMALVAPDGRFLRVNRALCDLVGYPSETLLTKTFQEITHPEDLDLDLELVRQMLAGERRAYAMEKRYFHADGHTVWVLLSVSLVRGDDDEPRYFISQIQDVSERKQLEQRLTFLADHDEMTGLPNRRRLGEELERAVAFARRYEHPGALLILDLDNFKRVNDTLGHHVGDSLVREVAGRLRGRLRQGRRGRDPEADEHRQRFDGDADVALQAGHAAVDLVEALGDDDLAPLGIVGRQEGCDGGFRDHGLRLVPARGEIRQRLRHVGVEIDGELRFLPMAGHGAHSSMPSLGSRDTWRATP